MHTLAGSAASDARTPVRLTAVLEPRPPASGELDGLRAVIRNLGRSGTLCFLEEPGAAAVPAAGDELTLRLTAPAGGEALVLETRVARVLPEDGEAAAGGRTGLELEFSKLSDEARERLTGLLQSLQPGILLVGFSGAEQKAFGRLLGRGMTAEAVEDEGQAFAVLDAEEVAVLCLGSGFPAEKGRVFLEALYARDPHTATVNLVLAAGREPGIFQDLISDDRLYYMTQQPVLDADLMAIVRSAVDRWWTLRLGEEGPETEEDRVQSLQEIVEVARRVALQRSLSSAGELTETAIENLLDADRAYYLIYEPARELLWAGEPGSRGYREESAAVGLVSFVARTGRALLLDHAGSDPRYEQEADDAEGSGGERFLAVPVRGSNRSVLAVLVAVRQAHRPPFSDRDLVNLELLADQVTSSFAQLALQARLDGMLGRREESMRESAYGIFREEAVGYHTAAADEHGHVLQLSPTWTRWAFWLLLGLLLTAFVFSLVGTLREWASGPAVVRMQGNRDLTATTAGVVTAVAARPGETVEEGRLLVRFYGAQEVAELQRIEEEFKLQLVNRLRNPSDRGAASALIALRAQRQLAEARLEEKALKAPFKGRISDIRVRQGQLVSPGDVVVSMVSEWVEPSIVALLPGHYRPLLDAGLPLRFEVAGYEYAYMNLTVDAVGAEVIGPNEARRLLGPAIADAVTISGGVVPVEARLPASTFEAAGVEYDFHDGMYGNAEVAVRSDRILFSLFPALKTVFEDHEGTSRAGEVRRGTSPEAAEAPGGASARP